MGPADIELNGRKEMSPAGRTGFVFLPRKALYVCEKNMERSQSAGEQLGRRSVGVNASGAWQKEEEKVAAVMGLRGNNNGNGEEEEEKEPFSGGGGERMGAITIST